MGLFKRNGNYWISYFDPPGGGGKRIKEKVGPVKQDAETLLGARRQQINQGLHPELLRVRPVRFKDHAAEVIEKHYRPKRCHEWAKLVIDVHLIPFFGDRTLAQVTAHVISDYMTHRLAAGVSNGTVNNERAVLSKVMSLAVKWERIPAHPMKDGKVEKLEHSGGRLRFLAHDEADKLTQNAPNHLRPVIVTALETGGRLSEVLGLKREDVDLGRGLLFFSQTNTKSGKQREIPMTPTLIATLKAIPRGIAGAAREYVFTRYGKRLQDVRTAFEVARARANLGKDVTFHTLRHTFASWYIMRPGSDLNLLRELLGHQDLKTTMIYAHLSPTYRKAAVPLMGRQAGADCPRNVPADADQEMQTA